MNQTSNTQKCMKGFTAFLLNFESVTFIPDKRRVVIRFFNLTQS